MLRTIEVVKNRKYHPLPRLHENILNTTHGSGWIIQVQPTERERRGLPVIILFIPFLAFARKGITGTAGLAFCRSDLNDPPTAVGGI